MAQAICPGCRNHLPAEADLGGGIYRCPVCGLRVNLARLLHVTDQSSRVAISTEPRVSLLAEGPVPVEPLPPVEPPPEPAAPHTYLERLLYRVRVWRRRETIPGLPRRSSGASPIPWVLCFLVLFPVVACGLILSALPDPEQMAEVLFVSLLLASIATLLLKVAWDFVRQRRP
jgi:hypothetical protein